MSTKPLRENGYSLGSGDNTVFVTAYGAVSGTDCTAAFQAAAAALVQGNTLVIPAGNFTLTDTIAITVDHVHVVGAGTKSTIITFNPASAKPCFKFDNGGGVDRMYGPSIQGIYFVSGNTTIQKIAIDLVDTSGAVVRDIWVDTSSSATPPWRGANSIGIRARGRELTVIDRVRLWADTPISIEADPYISTPVSCDHLHISNAYLLSTPNGSNACLKIADGVIVSNFTMDGTNDFVVDKYGVYWVDTGGATTNSWNVMFSNMRFEQFHDAASYAFYIQRGKGLQNIEFKNIYVTSGANGIFLDGGVTSGVGNVTIRNSYFTNTNASFAHLQTPNAVSELLIDNVIWVAGGTAALGSLVPIWTLPQNNASAALPAKGFYSTATQQARSAQAGSFIAYAGGASAVPAVNPWIAATLLNSWVALDVSHPAPAYFKDALGFVHIRGDVKSGATPTSVIFTLPAGYRPLLAVVVPITLNAAAIGQLQVSSNGNVAPLAGNTTQTSLGSFSFLAEQ